MPIVPRQNARGSPRVRLVSSLVMLAVIAAGVSYYSVRETNKLFDIGVEDHIRCAVEGNYPKQSQRAEMVAGLGDRFSPMLQPLSESMSDAMLVSAHRCNIGGRDDAHIIFKKNGAGKNGTLVSVVVAKRADEDVFPRALSGRTLTVNGIQIHEGNRQGYSVAAFQSGAWLGYVVSGLPESQNEMLARRIVPVIAQYTSF